MINYQRLYEHRFRDVHQARRDEVWGRSRRSFTSGLAVPTGYSTPPQDGANSSTLFLRNGGE